MEARLTYTATVRAYLTSRPLAWVSSDTLHDIGGKCGWRTRVSVVRRALIMEGLGTIINKPVLVRNLAGKIVRRDSFYRFEPVTPMTETPSQGHDMNEPWGLR